jgi:hypothetical protein
MDPPMKICAQLVRFLKQCIPQQTLPEKCMALDSDITVLRASQGKS